jgi:hypothetical protein
VIIAIEFAAIGAVVADVSAASGTGLQKAAGVSVNLSVQVGQLCFSPCLNLFGRGSNPRGDGFDREALSTQVTRGLLTVISENRVLLRRLFEPGECLRGGILRWTRSSRQRSPDRCLEDRVHLSQSYEGFNFRLSGAISRYQSPRFCRPSTCPNSGFSLSVRHGNGGAITRFMAPVHGEPARSAKPDRCRDSPIDR